VNAHTTRRACLLALTALAPADALAGAWAQEERGLYAKLAYGKSFATEQFKDGGETLQLLSEDLEGSFDLNSALLYVEYGAVERLTFTLSAALMDVTLDSPIQRVTVRGFGDVILGGRYQFIDGPVVASVMANFKTPGGYSPELGDLRPTLGNGVNELDGRLSVGASFYPIPAYFSVDAGFRWRGSRSVRGGGSRVDFSNEIPFTGEVGYGFDLSGATGGVANSLLLRGAFAGVYGLGDPGEINAVALTPTVQRFLKVGPSVIVTLFDEYQVSVDYMYTPLGVNALQSHDVFVGLAFDTTL
jgi:hypothetical protein